MSWDQETCERFWAQADKDNSGFIDGMEMSTFLKQFKPDITHKEVASIVVDIGGDDKKISRDEFFNEMVQKQERSKGLAQMFTDYDKDKSGCLTSDELKQLLNEFFEPEKAARSFEVFMEVSDANGDGKFTYEEFKSFFG